ncbi:MAG: DsrE family protein [Chloroflexota bacterium]|jgi:predicted peroxiredoxin
MARMLIHLTTGPENPTRAALALLVARTALANGHAVDVFLAGDGVDYLRPETRAVASGIGTGSIAEHWDALVTGGAGLFGSGMSAKARNVTSESNVELAPPDKLVELIDAADKVVVY